MPASGRTHTRCTKVPPSVPASRERVRHRCHRVIMVGAGGRCIGLLRLYSETAVPPLLPIWKLYGCHLRNRIDDSVYFRRRYSGAPHTGGDGRGERECTAATSLVSRIARGWDAARVAPRMRFGAICLCKLRPPLRGLRVLRSHSIIVSGGWDTAPNCLFQGSFCRNLPQPQPPISKILPHRGSGPDPGRCRAVHHPP